MGEGRKDTKEGGWRHTRREGYTGWEPASFYWVSRVYDHSMSRVSGECAPIVE